MPSTPRVWLLHCTVLANGHIRSLCFRRCVLGSKAAEEARPGSFSNDCDAACSAGCLYKWHTLLMALGNAVTGKKLLHGAVTTSGGRPTSNLTKDGPKKQHEMEAFSHWTSKVLGTTAYATARGCPVAESQGLQVLDGVELLDKGAGTSLARDAELETS